MIDPSYRDLSDSLSPHKIFVGTFHKSGTVLMQDIWTQACRSLGLVLWEMHDHPESPPAAWQVAFHYKSKFGDLPLRHPHRGMLVFRDPRDVIISGMHYHRKSPEPWLHKPDARFDGLTYQQRLNSLATDTDRLLFEMEHQGRKTIKQMQRAMEAYPDFYHAKLEHLVEDRDLAEYQRIFQFLGFDGNSLGVLLDSARRNSLFAGSVTSASHVRSGRPALWRDEFPGQVMDAFLEKYGDLPERWGYPAP